MDPDLIREFAARRWDLVGEQKLRIGADRYRSGGATACLAVLIDLRERSVRARPGGCSDESRRIDLDHHVELAQKLRLVDNGRTRR